MCGIAGIISLEPIDGSRLKSMTDAIAHRGPDGEGHWFNTSASVGLGHRRLAIIDLSDKASQPMLSADNRFVIVFNGEIYNYVELKKDLEAAGHIFRTQSDTEVLLKLYQLKKEKCLDLLDGMFAFAIWDNETKELFCARDRFGEKPFYYHHIPGKSFAFASEMKAIFASGVQPEVNNEMLYNFLQSSSYVTNPLDRTATFYSNIHKLAPASYLILTSDQRLRTDKYWKIDSIPVLQNTPYPEARERFKELLTTSVKRRLRSDVPVGSSLSGGLDSSSIVCLIHQLNKEKKIRQNTFSARFKNFDRDEGEYIDKVIAATDVQSYFTWPDEEGFINDLEKLLYHQEEPFQSASIYAQYCVMKKAKEENITVLLDGQGADELLAGYEYFLGFYLQSIHRNDPLSYEKELKTFSQLHKHLQFKDLSKPASEVVRTQESVSVKNKIKNAVRPIYALANPSKYRRINNKLPMEGFFSRDFVTQFDTDIQYDFSFKGTHLNNYLKHSIVLDNLEDLLRFCDRNSMAHSREVRLPFLSHELAEFVLALPPEYKIHEGWTKYILRDSLKDILPPEIAWRVNKVGYEPPQEKWMKNKKITDRVQDSFHLLQKRKILHKNATLSEDKKWAVLVSAFLLQKK